jgi:hypothetical protein
MSKMKLQGWLAMILAGIVVLLGSASSEAKGWKRTAGDMRGVKSNS